MSGLGERIVQARTRSSSVGAHAFLLSSPLLGASFVAVAATEVASPSMQAAAEPRSVPFEAEPAMAGPSEMPPEAHIPLLDIPPPPPLAVLRDASAEDLVVKPARRVSVSKKTIHARSQVNKMSEPIVRLKNGNGNGHHRASNGVVHVTIKKRSPSLDAPEKALVWLQGLVKKVHVGAVPTMLDYYRRLGWIPNDAYGMIVELSIGLTKSAQPATWKMVRNDPSQLAAIHRESYKHLKSLFGDRLNRSF